MPREYDNRGKGVLFRNEDKQEEKHPDYRGNITLHDGTECWLDAWINTSKKGQKFMALRMKPKMAREHAGAAQNPPPREPDPSDDIPF